MELDECMVDDCTEAPQDGHFLCEEHQTTASAFELNGWSVVGIDTIDFLE